MSVWLLLQHYNKSRVTQLESDQLNHFDQLTMSLQRELEQVSRDIHLISGPGLYKFYGLDSNRQDHLRLRHFLKRFLNSRHYYERVQLVHADGRELIRIGKSNGIAVVATEHALRTLAAELAAQLNVIAKQNSIYLSFTSASSTDFPSALIPPLQFSTTIADHNDQPIGLLLITLNTADILATLMADTVARPFGQSGVAPLPSNKNSGSPQYLHWNDSTPSVATISEPLWQTAVHQDSGFFDDGHTTAIFKQLTLQDLRSALSSDDNQAFEFVTNPFDAEPSGLVMFAMYSNQALRESGFEYTPMGKATVAATVLAILLIATILYCCRRALKYYLDQQRAIKEEFNDLYDNAPCGYFSIGPDLVINKINRTMASWLNSTPEQIVGKFKVSDLLDTSDPARVKKIFPALKKYGSLSNLPLELTVSNGKRISVLANGVMVADKNGQLREARCTLFDYRELKQIQDRLEKLATFDSLSGLYLRRVFDEMAAEAFLKRLVSRESVVIMLIDIDHFKRVNDSLGHDAGDVVIKYFAQQLNDAFRDNDVIARYGGEEFAVLLKDTDINGATTIATRLLKHVAQTAIDTGFGNKVRITVSMGVSAIVDTDKSFRQALKRADIALYNAKAKGRNCVEVCSD